MVKSCCIEGCDVSSPDVEYFKFPRSGALLAAWVEATGAPGGDVCSAHFTEADYKSMRGHRRLLGTAVPSVFAKPTPTENGDISTEVNDTNKNVKSSPKKKKSKNKKSTEKAKADSTTDNEITDKVSAIDKTDESTTDTDVTEKNVENGESSQDETRQSGEENGTENKNRETLQPEVNDIEDMITNYQIKQPPLADRLNPDPLEDLIPAILESQIHNQIQEQVIQEQDIQAIQGQETEFEVPIIPEVVFHEDAQKNTEILAEKVSPGKMDVNQLASHIANKLDNQLTQIISTAPVFIEVAVDQNDTRAESPQDCLMLLESVQCDIDPSSLMLPEHGPDTDSDMEIVEADSKVIEDPNPISLLTSSDEDEVIIEEPHIDTVEVSDETDEDDRPLQRLIKEKPKPKKPEKKKKKQFEYFVHSSPYYCVQCDYRTDNEAEFIQHNLELAHLHGTTIQVCSTCNYSTASKAQFSRHKRKHRDERNFKCHLCNYKARHNMSLIYHLRCHDTAEKKQDKFTCDKCGFSSNIKSEALSHLRNKLCEKVKKVKYSCDQCSYSTKRRSDLRRHRLRRHSVDDSDEDFTI